MSNEQPVLGAEDLQSGHAPTAENTLLINKTFKGGEIVKLCRIVLTIC